MVWQPEMDELRRRQEMTKRMGGADKVKRQHDGGRLTVRERLDRLVDKDSFREIGSAAGMAEYDGKNDLVDLTPGNSVMGRAKIDGRHVSYTKMTFPRPLVGPQGGPHTEHTFVSILNAFGVNVNTFGDATVTGANTDILPG